MTTNDEPIAAPTVESLIINRYVRDQPRRFLPADRGLTGVWVVSNVEGPKGGGEPTEFASLASTMRVYKIGVHWTLCNERGMFLRGARRVLRKFKSAVAAALVAEKEYPSPVDLDAVA